MKPVLRYLLGAVVAFAVAAAPALAARVGEPAPDFSLQGSDGKTYNLSDFRGKFVVLEWHNQGCPYVQKHYETGNMQKLQREWTAKGVAWFKIISSAPGTQGYVTPAQENDYNRQKNAAPTASLLDPTGKVGHLYDARTTPQMVLIGPDGTLLYNGAIDDRPTSNHADVNGAKNYIAAALTEAMAGKPVSTPTTRPYGCTVKYAGT